MRARSSAISIRTPANKIDFQHLVMACPSWNRLSPWRMLNGIIPIILIIWSLQNTSAAEASLGPSSSPWSMPKGTNAIVTGGTRGIGRAIVEELAANFGCRVLLCSRSEQAVQECLEDYRRDGRDLQVDGVAADVSTPEGRQAVMDKAAEFFSTNGGEKEVETPSSSPFRLDILVNNAGTNIRKLTPDYSEDELDFILRTNLISMFELTKMCYPMLKRSRETSSLGVPSTSSVINIGSVGGVTCMKRATPYAMTKAAMNQFTGNLACEWGPHGIRVNCVAPWYIKTDLAMQVLKDEEYRGSVLARTPAQRIGEPWEVCGLVSFLCLPIAGYLSGQVICVDGGVTRNGFYDTFYDPSLPW